MEIYVNTMGILAMGIGISKCESLLTEMETLQYKLLFRTFYFVFLKSVFLVNKI